MKTRTMLLLADAMLVSMAGAGEIDLAARRVSLPGSSFTVAVTVTPAAQTNAWSGTWGYLCGLGTGYWDGFRLRLRPSRLGCEPSLEIGKPKGEGSYGLEAPGVELPAGVGRHLAASWDGRTARLYVGGRCVAQGAFAGRYVQEGALPFTLGGAAYGLVNVPFAHGPVRMWNEALAPEAIARLAAEVPTCSDAEIAAYARRPMSAIVADYLNGMVKPEHRALVMHLLYAAMNGRGMESLPVRVLDQFANAVGTNDAHRVLDFKLNRARALVHEGRAAEGRAVWSAVWDEAKKQHLAHAAWAGLAYADMLEGAAAEAVRAEARALSRRYLRNGPARPAPKVPDGKAPAVRFFVSPTGDDAAAGTLERPFATLGRAQQAVRDLKAKGPLPKGGVAVCLRGGVYPVTQTLALAAADGGEPEAPVVWEAYADERPVLDGGWRVPAFSLDYAQIVQRDPAAAKRISAAARAHIVACDVRQAGYTHFEPQPDYGFYCGEVGKATPITDLWCGDQTLQLARDPNDGWLQTGELLDAKTNHVFRSSVADFSKWLNEPELMLTGFWCWHWADLTRHVSADAFDSAAHTITLGRKFPTMLRTPRPYFFVNALVALDRPGEWFLDRTSGLLYAWPPADASAGYVLSSFSQPFVTLKDVKNLVVRGLVFQHGRGSCLVATDCAALVFAGNVVRRFGTDGAWFLNSRDVAIRGNMLRDFGHGALRVSGGDRKTLAPSGIVITDNDVAFVERWKRTYAPGLHGDGCGTEVVHNRFHDMRSSAMRLEGNDWWVASNIVERVVTESDDQGGIDIFANPTYAGDVIAFNVWRNIGCGGENVPCGQAGVRFDDAVSSMTVYANRFENCSFGHFGAVQMNGGRNNVVDNNLFVRCAQGVSIGRWPQNRWCDYFKRSNVVWWWKEFVTREGSPYRAKYDGLEELPKMELVNYLVRNVVVGDGILSSYPKTTVTFGNRSFAEMPSEAALEAEPGFVPLPSESALGPRLTGDFARAARNARQ